MTRPPTPTNQEGPDKGPPALPEGWYVSRLSLARSSQIHSYLTLHRLAQWEGQSRKYYYVQRATGHSQWEVPTQPALSVPTPDPTPQQYTDPFRQPPVVKVDGATEDEEKDRSLLGVRGYCLSLENNIDTAINRIWR